jgi:hypothetical protein
MAVQMYLTEVMISRGQAGRDYSPGFVSSTVSKGLTGINEGSCMNSKPDHVFRLTTLKETRQRKIVARRAVSLQPQG